MIKLNSNDKIEIDGTTYYFYIIEKSIECYFTRTGFYTEKKRINYWSFDFKRFKFVKKHYYIPIELFVLNFDINDPFNSKDTVKKALEFQHKIQKRKEEIKNRQYI